MAEAKYKVTSIEHLLNRSKGDNNPLLSWKWICTSLPFGFDPTYVETLDLPFCNIDVQPPWHGGASFTYYPNFSNITAFSLTFYEDSAMSTLQWLTFWKNKIKVLYPTKDQNGAGAAGSYFLPKNYKRNIKFMLLATDNSEVLEVTLVNVFPTDTGNLSLSYSDSERIKITQSFSCDDQSLNFKKEQIAGAQGANGNLGQQIENAFSNLANGTLTTKNTFNFF